MTSPLVGLLTGALDGYVRGMRLREDMDQREADRAYVRDQRARQQKLQAEDDALRASMKTAAAPAAVEPVDVPAEGPVEPGAAAPMKQGFKVNGTLVGGEGNRDQAVASYNAQDAVMARMADAQMAAGRPDLAMETRQKAAQSKLAGLQLDDAQRTALNKAYDDDLNKRATTFDALGEFISGSKGDGQGGSIKVKPVPSADGKQITFNTVGNDGSMTPTPYTFENSPTGLLRAKALLSQSTTPENKLTHLHQQAMEDQAAAQLAETTRHNKATEATNAEKVGLMTTIQELKNAGRAGAGSGPLTMADLKDGHKTIASTLTGDYKSQIDNEPDPVKVKAIKTARESEIDSVQRVYTGALTAGIAMTPEQAIAAFRTGDVGTQTFKTKDGGTTTVDVLRVNGRLIPMSAAPGVGMAAPTTSPASKPSGNDPAAPAAKAPAAAPDGPGVLARMADNPIVKRISELGTDYTSEAGKAALAKRVTEAGKGGAPLTEVETLRAKQAGLI